MNEKKKSWISKQKPIINQQIQLLRNLCRRIIVIFVSESTHKRYIPYILVLHRYLHKSWRRCSFPLLEIRVDPFYGKYRYISSVKRHESWTYRKNIFRPITKMLNRGFFHPFVFPSLFFPLFFPCFQFHWTWKMRSIMSSSNLLGIIC